jgi:hypothetical protein
MILYPVLRKKREKKRPLFFGVTGLWLLLAAGGGIIDWVAEIIKEIFEYWKIGRSAAF